MATVAAVGWPGTTPVARKCRLPRKTPHPPGIHTRLCSCVRRFALAVRTSVDRAMRTSCTLFRQGTSVEEVVAPPVQSVEAACGAAFQTL